jgi:parallel beta-helix repeat protein
MKKLLTFKSLLVLIVITFNPFCALADTYFVRPNQGEYGVENGLAYDTAFDGWGEILWGEGKGKVGPGDTLFLCGVFTDDYINITIDGTETNRVIFRGDYDVESGIVNASGRSKAIRLDDAAYVTLKSIAVEGAKNSGIGCASQCRGLILENVVSHDNQGSGFEVLGQDLILRNCTAYNNKHSGIRVSWADNSRVLNSYVYNNGTGGSNHDGIFIGNGSKNFLVKECFVLNQKGQSSYDVSDTKTQEGRVSGTFIGCRAINGPTYGFHSAITFRTNIFYKYCEASNHKFNFQAGLYNGSGADFRNCTGKNDIEKTAGWTIQGRGERYVRIENCTEYAQNALYVINIGDSEGLTLIEINNKWYGGTSAFAKINGKTQSWEKWVSTDEKVIQSSSQFTPN